MESNVPVVKLNELTILGNNDIRKEGNLLVYQKNSKGSFCTIEDRDNLFRQDSNRVKSQIKIEAKVAAYVTLKRGR